jgi:hypothetical protein
MPNPLTDVLLSLILKPDSDVDILDVMQACTIRSSVI